MLYHFVIEPFAEPLCQLGLQPMSPTCHHSLQVILEGSALSGTTSGESSKSLQSCTWEVGCWMRLASAGIGWPGVKNASGSIWICVFLHWSCFLTLHHIVLSFIHPMILSGIPTTMGIPTKNMLSPILIEAQSFPHHTR